MGVGEKPRHDRCWHVGRQWRRRHHLGDHAQGDEHAQAGRGVAGAERLEALPDVATGERLCGVARGLDLQGVSASRWQEKLARVGGGSPEGQKPAPASTLTRFGAAESAASREVPFPSGS